MGTLSEGLHCSRLAESALITVYGVTASRRVAAKPTAITIATVALGRETWQQEEALVVECVVAEGGGAQGWGHSQCEDQRRHESTMPVTEVHEPLESLPNGEERSG